MDKINILFAVITIIVTVLFGSFSVVTAIIYAVWKIGLRFSIIESRLASVEAKIDIKNGKKAED